MKDSFHCIILVIIMATVNAFAPLADVSPASSQSGGGRLRRPTTTSKPSSARQWLVPSQVVSSRIPSSIYLASTAAEAPFNNTTTSTTAMPMNVHVKGSRRSRRRKRPLKKKAAKKKDQDRVYDQYPTTGNLPDPWYRAISMEALRQHPRFVSLAPTVTTLETLDDVSLFRQESWQWDALHVGRCTTSQAVGALGFLDPSPAQVLNIPNSWRKGARGAYQRLSQTPVLRTLEDMRRVLLVPSPQNNGDDTTPKSDPMVTDDDDVDDEEEEESYWKETSGTDTNENGSSSPANVTFAADYLYQPTEEEFKQRRKFIKERSGGDYLTNGIRLIWGNTQEATAVLTALNYFCQNDSDVVLKESGMCGAGLALNQTDAESSLLVGATPDAVLCHGDGRLEAVEVKNHCPFFSNLNRKRHGGKLKAFSIGDRPLGGDVGVMSQYVPQLQLEMYCLGPKCQSAVMVRQTATQGAVLLRMMRDDEWIEEMLYFLHRFMNEHVQAQKPPKLDFFWNGTDASRYRRFVHRTIQVRDRVKVIATLPQEAIQRGSAQAPFFLD